MSILDNVRRVREAMGEAAVKAARPPDGIRLVAAAKTNGPQAVREAIAAGVDAVGENRVQELLEKDAAGAYAGAPLHFIGHLQSNKVRQLAGRCDLIESVGSAAVLELLGRRSAALGAVQDVLIEVNIGREPNKSGVMPEELAGLLDFAAGLSGIFIKGLMAIPPNSGKTGSQRSFFDAMYQLYVDMSEKKYDNASMQLLSMGMSGSFEEAILAGSNMIRVGTAIFGAR